MRACKTLRIMPFGIKYLLLRRTCKYGLHATVSCSPLSSELGNPFNWTDHCLTGENM